MNENIKKRRIPRSAAILLIVLLVISVCAAGVYAYLKLTSGKIENTFTDAAEVTPTIEETFNDEKTVKSDVYVSVGETGYSVYVRAKIIAEWAWYDSDGITGYSLSESPVEGTDYTMDLNTDDWFEQDGYYYYKYSVASSGTTNNLINTCTRLDTASPVDGYTFEVKIIAQTIQAAGGAATDAWGVSVDSSGNLTASS